MTAQEASALRSFLPLEELQVLLRTKRLQEQEMPIHQLGML
jgi:hypothetical protein